MFEHSAIALSSPPAAMSSSARRSRICWIVIQSCESGEKSAQAELFPVGADVARKQLIATRGTGRHAQPRHLDEPARMAALAMNSAPPTIWL